MVFGRFRRSDEVVGFAFSGGGSRGASQVGALRALTEAGIRPHVVAGSSAGAVNAAWYALHPHRIDRLEAIWMGLRRRDVFPGGGLRVLVNLARSGVVHRADAWERFLRREVGSAMFEDGAIPCAVTAVRLRDGKRVVFSSGEIVPALMATTAIPGVFPPYRIGDELYADGGVLEFLPLPTLFEKGATSIWALDCSYIGPDLFAGSTAVDRCGRIAARASVIRDTSLQGARGRKVHVLCPTLPEFRDAREFTHTAAMIEAGYTHAREYLDQILGAPDSVAHSAGQAPSRV